MKNRLKELRTEKNLTMEDVGKYLNLSKQSVNSWKNIIENLMSKHYSLLLIFLTYRYIMLWELI